MNVMGMTTHPCPHHSLCPSESSRHVVVPCQRRHNVVVVVGNVLSFPVRPSTSGLTVTVVVVVMVVVGMVMVTDGDGDGNGWDTIKII